MSATILFVSMALFGGDIHRLDSDDYFTREAAAGRLTRAGPLAWPALDAIRPHASYDVRKWIDDIRRPWEGRLRRWRVAAEYAAVLYVPTLNGYCARWQEDIIFSWSLPEMAGFAAFCNTAGVSDGDLVDPYYKAGFANVMRFRLRGKPLDGDWLWQRRHKK